MSDQTSRRDFLRTSATAAFGALVVPRHVLGGPGYQAPSDTLNIAGIGVGGVGGYNVDVVASENIVALCDIDWQYASETLRTFPSAAKYRDYRVMFEEHSDIDAVIVATPDHTHAPIAQHAMKRGHHVYVQKPLTATAQGARILGRTAQETGVVAQMGNQGRSNDGARRTNELIRAGVIGTVQEVHVWTNRPIWPQGIDRPSSPETLREEVPWDLFLGPAPYLQYHSAYHPFSWRGWVNFGTGALGDMGAHLLDHPIWAMNLDYPTHVECSSTSFNEASFPSATLVSYQFPREDAPDLPVTWYDGGLTPPLSQHLPEEAEQKDNGVLYVGEDGVLVHDTYGYNPRVFPTELREEASEVPQSIRRIDTDHEMNWVNACKGQTEPASPFESAVPVTETMLLGVAALWAEHGAVTYDPSNGTIPNDKVANRRMQYHGRGTWALTA